MIRVLHFIVCLVFLAIGSEKTSVAALVVKAYQPQRVWNDALDSILKDKPDLAISYLLELDQKPSPQIPPAFVQMLLGRIYYEQGEFQKAIDSYAQVSKSSTYWFEALEEKAWSHLRLNQTSEALSELQTLMSPVFAAQVGPEPYYLKGLIELKVCNYKDLFTSIEEFKSRFRQRIVSLESLADRLDANKTNSLVRRTFESLQDGAGGWKKLGAALNELPRFFNLDGTLRNSARGNTESKFNEFSNRLSQLAQQEVDEMAAFITRYEVLTVEGIQRMHANKEILERNKKSVKRSEVDRDDLVFELRKDELPWITELGHIQVRNQQCPKSKKGRTL